MGLVIFWAWCWLRGMFGQGRLLERLKREGGRIKDTCWVRQAKQNPPETNPGDSESAQPEAVAVKILEGSRPATKIMTRMTEDNKTDDQKSGRQVGVGTGGARELAKRWQLELARGGANLS